MAARKKRNGRGGARPGAGRKPKAAEEKRRNRVVLFLTDDELERVYDAIGDEQIGPWIRGLVFRHLARRRR